MGEHPVFYHYTTVLGDRGRPGLSVTLYVPTTRESTGHLSPSQESRQKSRRGTGVPPCVPRKRHSLSLNPLVPLSRRVPRPKSHNWTQTSYLYLEHPLLSKFGERGVKDEDREGDPCRQPSTKRAGVRGTDTKVSLLLTPFFLLLLTKSRPPPLEYRP